MESLQSMMMKASVFWTSMRNNSSSRSSSQLLCKDDREFEAASNLECHTEMFEQRLLVNSLEIRMNAIIFRSQKSQRESSSLRDAAQKQQQSDTQQLIPMQELSSATTNKRLKKQLPQYSRAGYERAHNLADKVYNSGEFDPSNIDLKIAQKYPF
ncbi:hypothetical protein O6H91_20G034600 [Diphasiastrum complanatum]|uniref:Uncharacterized protein n=2 Tax=Diphasiastrum complanatum TaxID=34168 RepID=A0ACC2AQA3_DIPCM|nr:hypothetical protein O6H91_20G033900 [Diphasiastrum complanatum]KAJ7519333.1 hypothetical protein O6H91_20G034600 [Diphasiastrum complanatum]